MNNYHELEKEFNELVKEYEAAWRLLKARLTNMRLEMEDAEGYSPIESIKMRIKTFDSVVEKCERKGYSLYIDDIRKNIQDVVGVRIVTPFQDDIYRVKEAIECRPSTSIIECEDYVANPKDNGYSGLHLIVMVEVYFGGRSRVVPIEIQIRSEEMNTWAVVEHIVNYKGLAMKIKNYESSDLAQEVTTQFKGIADTLREAGIKAMKLRDLVAKLTEKEQ